MLEKRILNVKISDLLRTRLQEHAESSGLRSPIAGISWGRWEDEKRESYSIGFYEKDQIPTNEPIRIIEADGLEFLIVQDWICDELEGKTLDVVNGKLTLF